MVSTKERVTRSTRLLLDTQPPKPSRSRREEADLLIVRGNPAERIEDIEKVEMVFTNGLPYDPKMLLNKVKGQVGWQWVIWLYASF